MAASLTITSMMDMFTLILLFLLVFFDPESQGDSELELPSAAVQTAPEAGPRVRVARDAVSVGGKEVAQLVGGQVDASLPREGAAVLPLADALRALREARASNEDGSPPVLLVECDKRVPWGVLSSVLASASRAGFPKYRFFVVSEE